MTKDIPLDCRRCPAFCCRLAGYVDVTKTDERRLAKHLGLSHEQFEKKHIIKAWGGRKRRIKEHDEICQFLGPDRMCTVYEARPRNCRGYVCWDQPDQTVYEFASMNQLSVRTIRRIDKVAKK